MRLLALVVCLLALQQPQLALAGSTAPHREARCLVGSALPQRASTRR